LDLFYLYGPRLTFDVANYVSVKLFIMSKIMNAVAENYYFFRKAFTRFDFAGD